MTRTTTNSGAPIASDEHSQSVGPDGVIPITDHVLIEQMAQFNRERVPERVVHAKGGGAFGRFEVTGDVSASTRAAVFQPGTSTPVLARFSTVAGESGSADTVRDPRGFSVKFYSSEGNYDLVGNNTPVFFVKDPMKFQQFIRSQKRLPGSHNRDNGMQWDFWTRSPESAHQVTYLMGDRGIPKTWRHMNGYGSHTYQWIAADGTRTWVKYAWHSDQGVDHLTQEEGERMAGQDPDAHIRDLYEAIDRGDHPSWTLKVQLIPYEEASTYRFNPFDLTKTVSRKDYPEVEVGRMVLDTNPQNYFAQIEQSSFEPSNLVPGIDGSPDKMLQARMFSYADAHRYRVGTNYQQLPVNRPHVPVHSYSQDGAMRQDFDAPSTPVYAPNSWNGPVADPAAAAEAGGWRSDGELVRAAATLHAEDDDWGQAGRLVREVMDDAQRERLVSNIAGHVAKVTDPRIRDRAVAYWRNVDAWLGERVEAQLPALDGAPQPGLQQQR